MAIMAVLLSEYSNEKIDVLKTMTMLLIHDIVEIDAGDTYAYDEDGKKTQRQRELTAADENIRASSKRPGWIYERALGRIRGKKDTWGKFARTLDNIQL